MRARQETDGAKEPQEILAVPVGNSPGWPILVLSISLSVHLPIIPSKDGAKTRVETHVCSSGPGWFAHPQEASGSAPQLSLPTFPSEQLFKKLRKKKKRKKSHHHEWVTNTAGKIHGEHWWEGASSPWASQQPQSLIYIVHKPCALHDQNEAPLLRNNVYPCTPPNPEQGGNRSERGGTDRLMRMSVGETEAEASREI